MARQTKVTKAQAEQVLAAIRTQFAPFIEAGTAHDVVSDGIAVAVELDGPKLVMNFDFLGHGGVPTIVWESGPFEWAILATLGGVTEDESGIRIPALPKFDGFYPEPMTSWALSVFPI